MAEHILVVEHDPITLNILIEGLQSHGMFAVPVTDSEKALEKVQLVKFDGIFLNLWMPKLDGSRLATVIRQSHWNKTTPIVIISDRLERSTLETAFRVGGSFLLQKPVTKPSLASLISIARSSMEENRRRLVRVPLHVTVSCQSGPLFFSAKSKNISERGMLMEGHPALKPGCPVFLELCLSNQRDSIRCTGIVVRVDEEGLIGISFTHLKETDRHRIRLFVGAESEKMELSKMLVGLQASQASRAPAVMY